MTLGRAAACAGALVCLLVADVPGQTTFRTGIEVVRLDVSVMRDGRPVRGLTKDDFLVADDDVVHCIESASLESASLNVVMALDNSGSVAGEKLSHLVDAATMVVSDLHDMDRGALITFSERVQRRVAPTGNRAELGHRLRQLNAAGATSLRDGVMAALSIGQDEERRTVVIVFSDGRDTASWLTERNLLDVVRRTKPIVHAIEIVERRPAAPPPLVPPLSPNSTAGPLPNLPGSASDPSSFLRELTRAAGGRYWSATEPEQLAALFRAALDEMRTRYELTFYPRVPNPPGWHRLDVRLKRGSATIAARPGYFVAGPPDR
jgi:VWFA-related protein